MAISLQEQATFTCPHCGAQNDAVVWQVLDAAEQPEQVDLLRQERLNLVTCSSCGATYAAPTPLLFHDGVAHRVIFVPAVGTAEHSWRDQARGLHTHLVESIAEEERQPYLEDVQVAQDLFGIAHTLRKMARRQSGAAASEKSAQNIGKDALAALAEMGATVTRDPTAGEPPPGAQPYDEERLLNAIQVLLAANTPAGIHTTVEAHPVLLTAAADAALAQLADTAIAQREYDVADNLHWVRQMLLDMQHGTDPTPVAPDLDDQVEPIREDTPRFAEVPDEAYQSLLQVQTSDELHRVVASYPLLLEPWVDAALTQRMNQALDEENEALAQLIEKRRESLSVLQREESPPTDARDSIEDQVQVAVQVLLGTEGEEALAEVLFSYPVLLTDAAQHALAQIATEARAQDDDTLAEHIDEYRTMLQTVREGMDD